MIAPLTIATGVRADPAFFAYAQVPAARFVRWRVSASVPGATWSVTFRLWVSAYALA